MTDYLKLDLQDDGVLVATLNRPDSRNALRRGDEREIIDLCRRVNSDLSIKAVVFTGAGTVFCAGADLAMLEHMSQQPPAELLAWYPENIQQLPLAVLGLDVPSIAAVNGPALGLGFDIACMFDIRIAARSARFAESFIGLGLIPGDGGAWLSQHATSYATACELAFTGEAIDAQRALACGLVSRVVDDDRVLAEAMELASKMAGRSSPALRMTKRLMRAGRGGDIGTVLQLSAALQTVAHGTSEHRGALAAAIDSLAARRRA